MGEAVASRACEEFETLERHLSRFEALVREAFQALVAAEARSAIRRLKNGDPLTPGDFDVIRALLISDAQAYLKHENDFENWLRELTRLTGRIGEFANADMPESLCDLRGIVLDAVRLVPDIRNYLDQQRRVERFERALLEMDSTSRKLMAELITEQIETRER
ncbi:MAG TPA: hypothetical protein VGM03_20900 [Phycisphaerae bacterium]